MSATGIRISVVGHPEPAGSKKAMPTQRGWRDRPGVRWSVVDANDKADGWKQVVRTTALSKMLSLRKKQPLYDEPVEVHMVFRRLRPQSHTNQAGLSPEGKRNPYPATKPDVLKLARGVEDALTGVIYADDAQIVRETLVKEWGDDEGVDIYVTPMSLLTVCPLSTAVTT